MYRFVMMQTGRASFDARKKVNLMRTKEEIMGNLSNPHDAATVEVLVDIRDVLVDIHDVFVASTFSAEGTVEHEEVLPDDVQAPPTAVDLGGEG